MRFVFSEKTQRVNAKMWRLWYEMSRGVFETSVTFSKTKTENGVSAEQAIIIVLS